MRILNKQFMEDLISGKLSRLLEYVKNDDTLCLCIRGNYINVYYRGCNLLEVRQSKTMNYSYRFDVNYFKVKSKFRMDPELLKDAKTADDYVELIPIIKQAMDLKFREKPALEKETQQLILRENNDTKHASDTDYFISDIEYADSANSSRFDLIGLKWRSTSTDRKNRSILGLSLMELKFGDDALTGSAGITKHFHDMVLFMKSATFNNFIEESQNQFNHKIELGLERHITKPIKIDKKLKPEYILLLANHKPVKSALNRELKLALKDYPEILDLADVKIAFSSMMGYGLYESEMIGINDYLDSQKEDNSSEKD